MGTDWIHTIRGVTLVEGTLPRLARAIEKLAEALNPKEVEWEVVISDTSPGPGWEPFQIANDNIPVWKRKKTNLKAHTEAVHA